MKLPFDDQNAVSLQENTLLPLPDDSMFLDRIHITTNVPSFYLRNGHKALATESINNLENAVSNGVPENFAPESFHKQQLWIAAIAF